MTLPAVRAGDAARKACHDLGELIAEHHRAGIGPQVPEYAAVLSAPHAACGPLAAAADVLAPRLAGIDPDPFSVWCEDFAGDLVTAYRDAARQCRVGSRVLQPLCDQAAADVRTWRSRPRRRPRDFKGRELQRPDRAAAPAACWQQYEQAATQGDAR